MRQSRYVMRENRYVMRESRPWNLANELNDKLKHIGHSAAPPRSLLPSALTRSAGAATTTY
jgi:hypothetical protein